MCEQPLILACIARILTSGLLRCIVGVCHEQEQDETLRISLVPTHLWW